MRGLFACRSISFYDRFRPRSAPSYQDSRRDLARDLLRKLAGLAAVLKVAQRDWGWMETSPLSLIPKPRVGEVAFGVLRQMSARRLDVCMASGHPYLFMHL